jgi:hypothetical protein
LFFAVVALPLLLPFLFVIPEGDLLLLCLCPCFCLCPCLSCLSSPQGICGCFLPLPLLLSLSLPFFVCHPRRGSAVAFAFRLKPQNHRQDLTKPTPHLAILEVENRPEAEKVKQQLIIFEYFAPHKSEKIRLFPESSLKVQT